jgi:hypothetical protein
MSLPQDDPPPIEVQDVPFLLNGSQAPGLGPGELRRALEADPHLEPEYRFAQQVQMAIRSRAERSPVDAGAARLDALLRAEVDQVVEASDHGRARMPARAVGAEDRQRLSLRLAVQQWLQGWRSWLTPPLAAACVVVAAQTVVIVALLQGADDAAEHQQLRSGGSSVATVVGQGTPHLRVMFRDGATEADVRSLLQGEGLDIVAGPNAVGEYRLMARPGVQVDLARALERLRGDGRVASASADVGPVRSEH